MSVDRDEVLRIAKLAKLDLEDAEAERLSEEMNRILEHAERLRGLDDPADGDGALPGEEASGAEQVASVPLHPDPLARPPRTFAPEMAEGFFTVPPPPGVVGSDRE